MKLSELAKFVATMQAASGNTDPDVTFYKSRNGADPVAGPKESEAFMEFDIAPAAHVTEMQVIGDALDTVRAAAGDFNIPLITIPFYK